MAQLEKHALAGVRVLEFSQYIAGPVAGRMMGDMGAEVVKLEMPPIGDYARGYTAGMPVSPGYAYWNRGKQSICINVKRPEGAAIAHDLVRHFDVLIENYAPGVLSKYGFGYERLKQINPRLIMCSLSAMGQSGPLSTVPGTDAVAQAMSGMAHLTGNPGGAPVYTGAYLADATGGVNGLAAVLAALYYREKTGVGQYIDLALFECLFHLHDSPLANHLFSGGKINPGPCGTHRDDCAPCGSFKARDGYAIVVAMAHQWTSLCKIMGKPELENDPRFATADIRIANKLELAAVIEEWLQSFPTRDIPIKLLQENHLVSAPVLDIAGVLNHPQFKARDTLQNVDIPDIGAVPLPKAPFHFSETPVKITGGVSLLGEDNQAVLGKYLGYAPEKVAALTEAGLLGGDQRLSERRR